MDNTSDHEPLTIQFDIQADRFSESVRKFIHKVAWHKASHAHIENYRQTVNNALGNIVILFTVLLCRDVKCCNSSHQLNTYASEISQALVAAAEVAIPHTSEVCCNKNKSIPGWTEFVEPLIAKSLFRHNVWVDCDMPKTVAVTDVMRRTRASYHYAIRCVRRNKRNIINKRFADAMLVDNTRDFW